MLRHFIGCLFVILVSINNKNYAQEKVRAELDIGKTLFQTHCGRCHGMKGEGGTGPSLKRPYLPSAPTDEKLADIAENGIPGTAMPGSFSLNEKEKQQVVKFVRFLGQGESVKLEGDIGLGKVVFEQNACSTCHIISGIGGSLGPDLTQIGIKRGPTYLIEAVTHPGSQNPMDQNGYTSYLVVTIEMNNGTTVTGVRINEDTFTIQVKDASNQFYSVQKSKINPKNS